MLEREEGLRLLLRASDQIRGNVSRRDGFQSGDEKEAHLIFRLGLSICPRMKMSFRQIDLLLANGDIPEDELRKASSRLGFSRLRTVDPYLYRPYESATDSGGRGVC